jgi:hypothetical protein
MNITIKQGEDFYRLLEFTDENDAKIDITSYEFKSQVRKTYTSKEIIFEFTFNILDQVTNLGECEMILDRNLTEDIKINAITTYVYDIEMNDGVRTYRLMGGQLFLDPEVSK